MYTVTCESTADLPYNYLQKRNCNVIFYTYTIDGEEFVDNMGRDSGALQVFYSALKTKRAYTSQISIERYEEFFREQLKNGDVLHLAFSSGLSQSVCNAQKAAENVSRENLTHKIVVVDSLCGGGGFGLFVDGVLDQRDKGLTFEQLCDWAVMNRTRVQMQFFSTDLTYFRRSGRVSGSAMLLGNLLHICPMMQVNGEGKIIAHTKVLGEKKAMAHIISATVDLADDGIDYSGKVFVQHSNCWNLAQQAKTALLGKFKNLKDVEIYDIGMVMACHCGPGTVAVYFWGKDRATTKK